MTPRASSCSCSCVKCCFSTTPANAQESGQSYMPLYFRIFVLFLLVTRTNEKKTRRKSSCGRERECAVSPSVKAKHQRRQGFTKGTSTLHGVAEKTKGNKRNQKDETRKIEKKKNEKRKREKKRGKTHKKKREEKREEKK